MVPNGWSQKTLEDLSIVERGKFSARPRNDPRYFGGEMPFVQTGDVTGSKTYLNSFTQTLNQDGIGVSKVFPKGTILITIAANIGDTAITSFDVACPDSVVAIQPYSTKADTYWLKNVLDTKKEDLDSQSTQNAQKNINLQVLKPLVILTPPLSEQKKIAKILSTWDKAISATEQLLANSQQQKKALMQQLLTGKKRLLDKNGAVFPDWKNKKIGQFLKPYKELVPASTDLPILTSSRVGLYEQERSVINEGQYGVLPLGCFTYRHMSDDLIFKFNVNRFWKKGAISKEYPVFSTIGLDSTFLEAKLNFGCEFKKFAVEQKQGGTRTRLYFKNLCEFSFSMPCFEEQQKIAAVLSTADQEISALQQKLAALKQEKKALMQQLLTGKRRVTVN